MATTAAHGAAFSPASDPERANDLARAKRRLQLQAVSHLVMVIVALGIGAYSLTTGKGELTSQRVLYVEGVALVLGLGFGAILAWLLPFLVQSKNTAPYVFVSPFFILFFIFGLGPILFSAILSFLTWEPSSGLAGMEFAGLKGMWPANYFYSFTDPWFGKSLWNTGVIAVVSGLPQHFVGMPLAYFFHVAYKRMRNTVSGAYFLPFITSSVAISLIFNTLLSKDFGVVNAGLEALHRLPAIGVIFPDHHIDWLGKAQNTKVAVSFVVFWRYLGWNTVLYLSALQAISKDLFEAAEMDGASRWQTFTKVVVPLLRPMMLFAITLTIIGNLQLFEEPFIIFGNASGGVENSAMTTAMFMYKFAFEYGGEFGTACAISWMLFIIIAGLTWLNNFIFARAGSEGVA
jgi:multiple sugar transport system permease protein